MSRMVELYNDGILNVIKSSADLGSNCRSSSCVVQSRDDPTRRAGVIGTGKIWLPTTYILKKGTLL